MSETRIPTALRWQVWERDNFRCLHCGRRQYLTVDHIIPVSKGGKTEEGNLQTLCMSCNCSKGNQAQPRPKVYPIPIKQKGELPTINLEFLEPHLLVPEAAKQLGRPKMTLYRWIDADKIVYIKLGGILFIPKTEVERLGKEIIRPPGAR